MTIEARQHLLWWTAIALATAGGLALRIAAAEGGLWTDEAWSVIYAAQAHDAGGVFLRINHDNNHHLYSLWLQAVGIDASPLTARALAIVAGTCSIPAAAWVVARRSASAAVVGAILFAVSPTMVNFGSEARGYSLMLLAALVTLGLVTRAAEGRELPGTPAWLALATLAGMLAHLTMAAPIALASTWVYLDRRSALGPSPAIREALRLMGPALGAAAAVVLFVFAAAAASPTGMQLGGYRPFAWPEFAGALNVLLGWTLGVGVWSGGIAAALILVLALALWLRPPQWLGSQARLYALLILGVPLGVALVQSGNSSYARYYLCSALGLLLLACECIAHELGKGGIRRGGAVALLALLVAASAWRDWQLIDLQRGRPDAPLAMVAQRSPRGARVAFEPKRLEGPLTVAAWRARFRLEVARDCSTADYVVAERPTAAPTAGWLNRCGVRMHALGVSATTPLTGDAWVLYAAERLQTARAPVSGPAPGARNRRLPSRAGVAQG